MALHHHALVRIICTMTNTTSPSGSRAGIVGGSGLHGRRAAAAARRPPRDRGRARHRRLERRRAGRRPVPVARRRLRRLDVRAARRRPTLDGLDVVFLALPHGASQQLVPEPASARSATSSTSAPTSGCRPTVYEQWYGEAAHRARAARPASRSAWSSCTATRSRRARHVAAPGCYPTASSLALAPLLAAGLVEPTGIVVERGVGRLGRRPRARRPPACSPRRTRTSSAYGLLTHRHTGGDRAGAHPRGAARRCRCCSRRTSCR